ncbi:hypothetical protein [Mycobacteroides stephanolepidis]|uniref:hypothetical protein n=1 Tax=[Mycobacterium] stephanolepidis TaxID=1520670 RepID=UPI000BBAC214|nr:hypothetical protein [[Mycobacterium] stephanolepidis]
MDEPPRRWILVLLQDILRYLLMQAVLLYSLVAAAMSMASVYVAMKAAGVALGIVVAILAIWIWADRKARVRQWWMIAVLLVLSTLLMIAGWQLGSL